MTRCSSDLVYEKALAYAPVLKFGKGERFFPVSTGRYISQCSLHRFKGDDTHQLVMPPGYVKLEELDSFEGADYFLVNADTDSFVDPDEAARLAQFLDQQQAAFGLWGFDLRDFVKETYEKLASLGAIAVRKVACLISDGKLPDRVRDRALALYGGPDAHPPAYYFRVLPREQNRSRYDVLQYWFFYTFNDWATSYGGVNDHEADWEAVYFYFEDLTADDAPALAVYSGHSKYEKRAWSALERLDDDHPVVYVMPGSHASFSTPGPHFSSVELRWKPGDEVFGEPGGRAWAEAIDLSGLDWVEKFSGRWGARYLWINPPGVGFDQEKPGGSPAGPKFETTGSERRKWFDPVGWAGL